MPQYIEYVKVDAGDGLPATEYPTRNGPADPLSGINWCWTDTEQVPARYYGSVHGNTDTDVVGVLRVIEDDEWDSLYSDRLQKAKQEVWDRLASHRYDMQTGGITLSDGTRILTTDESIARQQIARSALEDGRETVDYKAVDGWITLNMDQLDNISRKIAAQTQDYFTAERRVADKVSDMTSLYDVRTSSPIVRFEEELEAMGGPKV